MANKVHLQALRDEVREIWVVFFVLCGKDDAIDTNTLGLQVQERETRKEHRHYKHISFSK